MLAQQTKAYQSLVRLAKRLGGKVIYCPEWNELENRSLYGRPLDPLKLSRSDWSSAPFCYGMGIYWKRKLIVHGSKGFSVPGMIHEMGHVFAARHSPHNNDLDETDFLGWEIILAKKLGVQAAWGREMGTYGLHDEEDNFIEIGHLTRGERKRIFAKHVLEAQKLGSLGPKGQIRTIRN